ncbi:diamine N-acetyltransferase [Paramicrobacterium agarici]|uniref:Diamine N-acetyltransferase n=2 Tax=Paramicrobacterium agarici TaxID=630514 RepID=A0A2A9DZ18_9MICO|nr:diamine N-acetyltransferase [Microbacterium agarici]TQO21950.1 diamine N-acetyltransferase [Microbacterium agarici]
MRVVELSASTIVAVNALSLRPGQEQFVAPVSYSVAAAVTNPATTWQRVVLDGDEVVGFVQGNFDHEMDDYFKSVLWRINVDAEAQRQGVGKFAVEALAAEARDRGFGHLNVMYEPGEGGPEKFFLAVGFEPVDETEYGEVVGRLSI